MEYLFAGTKHSIKESKANTKYLNFLVLSQTTRGRYLCLNKDFQSLSNLWENSPLF